MPERDERITIRGGVQSTGGSAVHLSVRLLGAAEVILDGRRLRGFNSPRLQAFLARIALRREPLDRAALAFEIWPESTERQARTNLRKLLHELRQALPGVDAFAEIGTGRVGWLSAGPSEVDVLSFREAIASGDFEAAARLYRGDLLPSCYDDWVLEERRALRAAAAGAHRRLAEAAAERGGHLAALRHAGAVSRLDPTDAAAVRIQMEAHCALGEPARALRTYHHYARDLRRELAIEPDAEITALCNAIPAGPSDRHRRCAPDPEAPPFVARDQEWHTLAKAWDTARAGRAHLVLLTGEPGIGKSRLAQELGRHVQADGNEVATARAYEAAGRLPWGPVADLLRSESIRRQVGTLGQAWTNELAMLLPELGSTVSQSATGGADSVSRRHRLFDAVCRAIAAHDRALVLIIDDLQWCDTETIEWIGYLLRAYSQLPVLIVGTVRWEELPDGHLLPELADALQRENAVTVVATGPLDQTSTAALAAELQGVKELEPELAERLWSETEGNPLFVIETIQAGITSAGEQGILTPTMRSVLRARLSQLTDGARELAGLAAVFGRSFSARELAAAMGGGERLAENQLDELWRRKIVIDRGQAYDFSHDKLREVAIEMINPARRRRLHRVVADVIAREYRDDPTAVIAQLAAHYDQAGLAEQAIEAYRTAGAQAAAMSGFDEAVSMYRRALALLAELPGSPDRDSVELKIRIALGSPLVAVKGYGADSSHRVYERALSLCSKLGRPADPPILRGLGLARLQGCRFDACNELAQALVDHEGGDRVACTEGLYLMGVSAFWQGDLVKACRFLKAAIARYDTTRREEHLARYAQDPKAVCLVRLGLATLWSGDPARAGTMARSADRLAGELDHLMTSAYVVTYGAVLAAVAGDVPRLKELLGRADRIWPHLSERYLKAVLDALQAWLEVCNGSGSGVDRIVRAVERSRVQGQTLHLSLTLLLLAQARGVRGELHEGRAAAREALAWSGQCGQRYLVAELLRTDGELAYSMGEAGDAFSSLHNAVDAAGAQGARWLALKALHSLAVRFPDPAVRAQLAGLAKELPSGRDLPAFRAAEAFLRETA